MPIMRMKADLYFIVGPTETWATSEAGEAAKKYAEMAIEGVGPKLYLLEKEAMYRFSTPIKLLTAGDVLGMMSTVITGRTPKAAKEPPVVEVPHKSGTGLEITNAPYKMPEWSDFYNHETCAKAVLSVCKVTKVGTSKNTGQPIYREVNIAIMKLMKPGEKIKKAVILDEMEPDFPMVVKQQKKFLNLIREHIYYLVAKGAIKRVGTGFYMRPVGEIPKGIAMDPEAERKAHEDTMAGAH